MIRRTIHLLIVAGILWAGWHATPVYWNYFAFKEAVEETALFAGARATEADLRARILKLAADHNVPLEPGALVVRIDAEVTEIQRPVHRERRAAAPLLLRLDVRREDLRLARPRRAAVRRATDYSSPISRLTWPT
jgi:hypothetical protein